MKHNINIGSFSTKNKMILNGIDAVVLGKKVIATVVQFGNVDGMQIIMAFDRYVGTLV